MTNSEQFANVLELLKRVPRPPEAKGLTRATNEQLTALQDELGFQLPESYRAWLGTCNGVLAGPGGLYGTATRPDFIDVNFVLGLYPEWKAAKWLPVAGDGNGNHYVLDLSQSHISHDAVFFVDTTENPAELAYIVGSTLPRFLLMLLNRELGERRWPFNREYMLKSDPAIATVDPISLLPWEA